MNAEIDIVLAIIIAYIIIIGSIHQNPDIVIIAIV